MRGAQQLIDRLLLFIVVVSLGGCWPFTESPKISTERPYQPPPVSNWPPTDRFRSDIPEDIDITLTIDNYVIRQNRITGNLGGITSLRFAGIFSDGESAYVKLIPNIYGQSIDDYYIAKLPYIRNGISHATAHLMRAPKDIANLPPPPSEIRIQCRILSGIVQNHAIINPSSSTIGLFLDTNNIHIDQESMVIVIRSRLYPDEEWFAAFPRDDGQFTVIAKQKSTINFR